MTTNELLEIIERVLDVRSNTLNEDTRLDTLIQWDSLAILNLQIEFRVHFPKRDFDALNDCKTVGDILSLCED